MNDWTNRVYLGSSVDMSVIPDDAIDSLITDPPAGIAFMGKAWDAHLTRQRFVDDLRPIFAECLRVMKPGAHGFVWALPRTAHWTMTALEDAGFEIRDVVVHLFGSGFPKSLDVSKAIDRAQGNAGSFGAPKSAAHAGWIERGRMRGNDGHVGYQRPWMDDEAAVDRNARAYVGGSDDSRRWSGWGTALKPGSEHWILVRKPLGEKTVAANVLRYGTGALNIDASRIGTEAVQTIRPLAREDGKVYGNFAGGETTIHSGRWPANVVLSHNEDCEQVGTRTVTGDQREGGDGIRVGGFYDIGSSSGNGRPAAALYGDEDVPLYRCTEDCAVAAVDAQSGMQTSGQPIGNRNATGYGGGLGDAKTALTGFGDTGTASRFFYVAKPAKTEKNKGIVDDVKPIEQYRPNDDPAEDTIRERLHGSRRAGNTHPTVKPTDLMCYLIRMITPSGGTVLDPFTGSGTTLVAAESMGFRWVGFEREAEYRDIALARLSQRSLFGGAA